jgi:hypothetical protein
VPADPLCRRDDDVCAEHEGGHEPAAHAEGVVDDEGDVVRVGKLGRQGNVERAERRKGEG